MKSFVKNITKKLAIICMIGSIGLLVTDNVLFLHSHQLADGEIITHAHPFNKSNDSAPFKSHHHSKIELIFLANLQLLFIFAIIFFIVLDVAKKKSYVVINEQFYPQSFKILYQGRAPPFS
ncbi:MAG: hypothetical protein J7K53_02595 [Bacteroidales bacterium]|nr:hypothetical protein [Bacteroidales bacterium]